MTTYSIPAADLALTALPPTISVYLVVTPQAVDFADSFNYFDVATPMFLQSQERSLYWSPGVINVILDLATPGATATFRVDGVAAGSATVGTDGSCGPLSLEVPAVSRGWHTITATVGTKTVSYDFYVQKDPRAPIIPPVPDADPQIVPAAMVGDVQRWVLQDLMPGGLGSWVMPANPRSMSPLPRSFNVEAMHSTSVDHGQFHLMEAEPGPLPWTFAGYCPGQEFYDLLDSYRLINRRFYLIDHRNRAWTVTFDAVEMVPRKRQKLDDGSYNDWAGDYTVRAVIYDQTPKTPV